jgi:aryl sulfotransferase
MFLNIFRSPRKKREIRNHHLDSTIWNEFRFRPDDIVIGNYAKSGATWMQQIVGQLVFQGAGNLSTTELSPWLDLRIEPKADKLSAVNAQRHRRFLKTHLPVDALVFSREAKYIYVARDGRDVVWSLYNHHARANLDWFLALNGSPGLVGNPIGPVPAQIRDYFHDWLDGDGYPFWPYWEHIRSWWQIRHLPNVLLVHFADLKADLPGEIRRIADFLDISIDQSRWPKILEHCGFDYMKRNAERYAPHAGDFWVGGAGTFINKGTNGRWRGVLNAEDCAKYERIAQSQLGHAAAYWLAHGTQESLSKAA